MRPKSIVIVLIVVLAAVLCLRTLPGLFVARRNPPALDRDAYASPIKQFR